MGCLCTAPISQPIQSHGAAEQKETIVVANPVRVHPSIVNSSYVEPSGVLYPSPATVFVIDDVKEESSYPNAVLTNHNEKKAEKADYKHSVVQSSTIVYQPIRIGPRHELGLFIPFQRPFVIPDTLHRLYHTENLQVFYKDIADGDETELHQVCQTEHQQGNLSATNNYAWLHLFGVGCDRDLVKAVRLFHVAATAGNLTAKNNVAICQYIGYGEGTEDSNRSLVHAIMKTTTYLRKYWLLGNKDHNGTVPMALMPMDWLESLNVYPLSSYLTIPNGGPLPKDPMNSYKTWAHLASVDNFRLARCNLGICDLFRESPNIDSAERHLTDAARRGCCMAEYLLSDWYSLMGTERSMRIEAVAEKGHALAMCHMVQLSERGSELTLTKWMIRGLEQRIPEIAFEYARFLGRANNHSSEEIFALCQRAAHEGCVGAQFRLCYCYMEGVGTIKDTTKYLLWMQQAAEHGCSNAGFALAVLYENEEEILKALQWYQTLARAGSTKAENAIERLRGKVK